MGDSSREDAQALELLGLLELSFQLLTLVDGLLLLGDVGDEHHKPPHRGVVGVEVGNILGPGLPKVPVRARDGALDRLRDALQKPRDEGVLAIACDKSESLARVISEPLAVALVREYAGEVAGPVGDQPWKNACDGG